MNFKRHWDMKPGLTAIYSAKDSGCQKMDISMLYLKQGDSWDFPASETHEYACTVMSGVCDVTGGASFPAIGKRRTVFEGKAYAFYMPRRTAFSVKCLSEELTVAVAMCPCEEDFPPQLVTPEDIIVKTLGKPGFERETHFIIDERVQAGRIYVGENFIVGGQWSGYPGHKHDTENMPTEGFAEEIYYYEYDKPTGFGVQRVYTDDKTTDEIYTTYDHDLVEVPYGYHPCAPAPGYRCYLLWMMSCDHRGFYTTLDPDHDWLTK